MLAFAVLLGPRSDEGKECLVTFDRGPARLGGPSELEEPALIASTFASNCDSGCAEAESPTEVAEENRCTVRIPVSNEEKELPMLDTE